jgi:hypothetical protein
MAIIGTAAWGPISKPKFVGDCERREWARASRIDREICQRTGRKRMRKVSFDLREFRKELGQPILTLDLLENARKYLEGAK